MEIHSRKSEELHSKRILIHGIRMESHLRKRIPFECALNAAMTTTPYLAEVFEMFHILFIFAQEIVQVLLCCKIAIKVLST